MSAAHASVSAPSTPLDDLAAALARHRDGQLDAAEAGYRRVLEADPRQSMALHLLGVLLLASNRADSAVALLRQAEIVRPGNAETSLALADACAAAGNRAEAIVRYHTLLAERPRHSGALVNLANALRDDGDIAGAITACRRALAIAPSLLPAHLTLGSTLLAGEQIEEAIAVYRGAIARAPNSAPAQIGLATALIRAERGEAALGAATRALALAPGSAEAEFIHGAALRAAHRFDAAVAVLRRLVRLEPGHARAHLTLGNAYADLDQLERAEHHQRRAIALDPTLAEAHASLGFLLAGLGRLDEAVAACDAAIWLRPNFARAYWNRSFAHLLAGNFEQGWEDYEWRKRHDRFALDFLSLPGPEWQGEPLAGRTLLVHAEQGLGDTIQFARYLTLLAERGARIVLACAPPLIPLLRDLPGVARTVPKTEPFPPYDLWVDQMSLPRLFGTRPATIPTPGGYLRIARARPIGARPRVGIVWAGNPAHSNDARRSMPVNTLAPILALPGIDWVSLQVGLAAADITATFGVPDQSATLTDFAKTAALVATLDLVLAVDTSTAHLAGAMGWPVWVMLPYAPEWRWMIGRTDSPWYASMRLFRQTAPGDWPGVAARVAAALAERTWVLA